MFIKSKLYKRIRNIVIIVIFILTIMITIGSVLILQKLGVLDFGETSSANSSISGVVTDADVKEVMAMSDEEVWKGLTNGVLTEKPSQKEPANAAQIKQAVEGQLVNITVPIRVWKSSNDSNMETEKKEVTLQVNSLLAKLWTAFFTDLYNEAPKFVIASVACYAEADLGSGTIGYQSAHPYGAGIDINPFGEGNDFAEKEPYTKAEWNALPENHLKYQIIYKDSEVVQIAHKYTLYWGGDWGQKKKDLMHFSFVCDGKTRAQRIQMFGN